jgi:RimJ/RimL family protein N-acetyltransferase
VKKDPMREVQTARLRLIPGTTDMVKAAIDDHIRLAGLLGASIPGAWPGHDLREVLPQFHQRMVEDAAFENWVVWFWVLRRETGGDILVGDGGFMGLPDDDGRVEIGYSILPDYRRRGYAREGVEGLLKVAFGIRGIDTVMAETEKSNAASIRLLEKLGFARMAGAEGTDTLWFALTRQVYET